MRARCSIFCDALLRVGWRAVVVLCTTYRSLDVLHCCLVHSSLALGAAAMLVFNEVFEQCLKRSSRPVTVLASTRMVVCCS